ncbi:hypothetical protein DPX16_20809 [Anabarilius grahami]|uniref:Uncharacterized protein n=1 Tax=Anabarilius grahami TaxID=495550 RepID=A0A3N0ZAM1_ANAGA|nr:hypothetical protein DPX16_20809 [Anabarilius grahami]
MKSSRACAPPLKSPACALPRDSPPPLYFNTVVKLSTPPHAHNHLFRVCSEHGGGGGARERSARARADGEENRERTEEDATRHSSGVRSAGMSLPTKTDLNGVLEEC